MSTIRLDAADAVEVAEILEFLIDWLDQLAAIDLRWLPLADSAYRIDDMRTVFDACRTQLLTAKIST